MGKGVWGHAYFAYFVGGPEFGKTCLHNICTLPYDSTQPTKPNLSHPQTRLVQKTHKTPAHQYQGYILPYFSQVR